jgi:hypothetical protein
VFQTLIVLAVVCVIGAIVGGGLKALGIEIPVITSTPRQLLLGTAGVVLLVAALITHSPTSSGSTSSSHSPTTSSSTKTSSSTSTTKSTSTSTTASVRHSGVLTLTYLYGADLDSLDPNWDVASYDAQSELGKGDVILSNPGLEPPVTSSSDLAPVTGSASYQTCAAATGYTSNSLAVSPGQELCVRTTEHRYAFLHVTAVNGNSNEPDTMSVTMTMTVWDPPFQ